MNKEYHTMQSSNSADPVVVADASSDPSTPLLTQEQEGGDEEEAGAVVVDVTALLEQNSSSAAVAPPLQPRRRRRSWWTLILSPLTDETGDATAVSTGLLTLFVVGGVTGVFVLPHDSELEPAWYRITSAAIGYIYFLAWSVSFYPQVLTNYRRKTTDGLSVDFCLLNVLGFACYSTYTVALYASPTIRRQYLERQKEGAGIPVESNDVAFCIHALVLSIITVGQVVWYGRSTSALFGQLRPIIARFILALLVWIGIVGPLLVVSGIFQSLDYLYSLSFIKVGISLVKYIPQVILNIQRQSTVGWSIWQILLDFTGGCLSDVQLVGDTWAKTPAGASVWLAVVTGNPAKLALGSLSMAFDIVFMVQHYILYPTTTTSREDEAVEDVDVSNDNDSDQNDDDDDEEADEVSSLRALNGACTADRRVQQVEA